MFMIRVEVVDGTSIVIFPTRDDAERQDELQEIASQKKLENHVDVDVQFAQDESEVDAQSGDEDGPRVGQGLG
jgi:hypothetical protein